MILVQHGYDEQRRERLSCKWPQVVVVRAELSPLFELLLLLLLGCRCWCCHVSSLSHCCHCCIVIIRVIHVAGFLGSIFWRFFGCFLKPGIFWLPKKWGLFFEMQKELVSCFYITFWPFFHSRFLTLCQVSYHNNNNNNLFFLHTSLSLRSFLSNTSPLSHTHGKGQ